MRAFVAINLPEDERARLHASLAPLRALALSVRWLPQESLHITLKFLGEIDAAQAARVEALLREVAAETAAFDIDAGGIGAFPDFAQPRVWWVGVRGDTGLLRAQSELEAALASAGHASEQRPFSPHITIGRTKTNAHRLPPAAHHAVQEIDYDARIHVESLDLMESRLSARGARYSLRLAAPLLPAAESVRLG